MPADIVTAITIAIATKIINSIRRKSRFIIIVITDSIFLFWTFGSEQTGKRNKQQQQKDSDKIDTKFSVFFSFFEIQDPEKERE